MKMVMRRLAFALVLLAALIGGVGVYAVASSPPAHADPCSNC